MSTVIKLKVKEKIKYYDVLRKIESFNYEKVFLDLVKSGTYRVVGGNIEIYPVNLIKPILIEYFGDYIERIIIQADNNKEIVKELTIYPNYLKLDDGSIIKPNNYVVHIDHGIGRAKNLSTKNINGKDKQYLNIEYLNADILYLPLNLKEKVSRYIGVGKKPKLNRLGSQSWNNTKKRAYENALLLARELLKIYAKREVSQKASYNIDKYWDKEIKKTFEYTETDDQLKAINDVYNDLQKYKPMDRLITGDVGFGKTEVALRAMTQAVANQKQAVLICPTTLLANQHFINISARVKDLPVKVVMLSRFVDKSKEKEVLRDILNGSADIIIGTHKILSNNIKYKNLDLVVIDEEQRFGVKQKEHFKKLRSDINILSLSATPIPRTLFMSLSGIRDILRGGQVYYLYNRVETINLFKAKMKKLLPKVRFAIAHGQMGEGSLSSIMEEFINNKYDVLICSTIIENGLDLPNVNTLIIDDSDNFGLSQLYQIRGRIGRSQNQAYCLLTHRQKKLAVNATKRLESLADNTKLGSGLNIAINDLEIRGGGNILGREQHGNMEAVGLVLYSQMLQVAVKNLSQLTCTRQKS